VETGENRIMKSSIICSLLQILLGCDQTKEVKWSRLHERDEKYENLKGRDCLEDIVVDGRVVVTWILKKYGMRV
jgi:hypothetical protein